MRNTTRRSRTAVRARVAEPVRPPWWLVAATAGGIAMFASGLAHGQTSAQSSGAPVTPVPEVVKPRTDSPTLPPTPGSGTTPVPRSVAPQADGGGARPIPDTGVIQPPVNSPASPAVIRPPATGTMPVIPPPGTAGGEKGAVPK